MINWFKRNFIAVYNHPVSNTAVKTGIIASHYLFGAVKGVVINPSGNYLNFLPDNEVQFDPETDTMNCTCFGASHATEVVGRCLWNLTNRYSPRFLGKMSDTSLQGNSMTNVLDHERKICGMVLDSDWPFTQDMSWGDYYSIIPAALIAKGLQWTKDFTLNYSVVPMKKAAIAEALKYSPLYVSGYAWAMGSNGYYQSWGTANHCFIIVGIDENGAYLAYDSYSPFVKKLDPNYLFGGIFSITLIKNKPMTFLQSQLQKGIKWVLLTAQTVINGVTWNAGVYNITADGAIPDTVKQDLYNAGVKALAAQEQLEGLTPADFERLINNKI